MTELAQIFAKHRESGLYTHAFAALGTLSEARPMVVEKHLPGGQDVFDLASLTKALATTAQLFQLKSAGKLDFEQTLQSWVGKAKLEDLKPVFHQLRVKDLLAHKSGLPAWRNFWVNHLGVETPERTASLSRARFRMVEVLNRSCATLNPAQGQVYSDVGFILLGLCLERVLEENQLTAFDGFCRNQLGFDPTALPLHYGPALSISDRAVPTAECKLRGKVLRGEVHDENCASLGGVAGHAGLFGTGEAVATFLHRLSQSPTGELLLAENAKARVLPVQDPPNEALVGWRQGADPSSLPFGEGGSMGHMGFTGVAFWVCPESGHYAILLTNRVVSGRLRPGIAAFRRDVFSHFQTLRR